MSGQLPHESGVPAPVATDRVLIVIPALNEEASIGGVLREIRRYRSDPILVVSDGSTDATASVASRGGATVLELPFNVGVGGALRLGFRYAAAHGFSTVVQVDADGQHDPGGIHALLEARVCRGADLVVGSRFHPGSRYVVGPTRRGTMRLLGALLSRIAGVRLTDTTSGFRAFGPRAVHLFAQDYPTDYLGDTLEALVMAVRAGLVVDEAWVTMGPRSGGDASTSPIKSAVFLLRALVSIFFALTRPRTEGRGYAR